MRALACRNNLNEASSHPPHILPEAETVKRCLQMFWNVSWSFIIPPIPPSFPQITKWMSKCKHDTSLIPPPTPSSRYFPYCTYWTVCTTPSFFVFVFPFCTARRALVYTRGSRLISISLLLLSLKKIYIYTYIADFWHKELTTHWVLLSICNGPGTG